MVGKATYECERSYPYYVTRGDMFMCVKATILIWLLMLKMDNWRDRVGTLNCDKKDLSTHTKKRLGWHEGLTFSTLVFKKRSSWWTLPWSCSRVCIRIDLIDGHASYFRDYEYGSYHYYVSWVASLFSLTILDINLLILKTFYISLFVFCMSWELKTCTFFLFWSDVLCASEFERSRWILILRSQLIWTPLKTPMTVSCPLFNCHFLSPSHTYDLWRSWMAFLPWSSEQFSSILLHVFRIVI